MEQPSQDSSTARSAEYPATPGSLPILLPAELKGLHVWEEEVTWRVDTVDGAGVGGERASGSRCSGALASSHPQGSVGATPWPQAVGAVLLPN